VSARIPLRTGVCSIRIAKSDVHPGIFFVLKNLANYVLQLDISANSKFADAIAVLIRVGVTPEIALEIWIGGMSFDYAILIHANS